MKYSFNFTLIFFLNNNTNHFNVMDNDDITLLVLLDFSEEFDTVNYNLLWLSCQSLGCAILHWNSFDLIEIADFRGF